MARAPGLAVVAVLLLAITATCSAVCTSAVTSGAYTIQSQVTQSGGETTFTYTVTRKTTQRPARLTSFSISIPDCLANGKFPEWGPKGIASSDPPVQIVKIGSYFFRWNFGFPANALKTTFTVTFAGSVQSDSRDFIAWSEDGTIGGHVDPGTICGPSACQSTTPIVVRTFKELKHAVETPPPAGCRRRVVNVAQDITWPKCCVDKLCDGFPCPTCCPLKITHSVLIRGCGARKTLDGNQQGNIIVQTGGSLSLSNLVLQGANTNTNNTCNMVDFRGGAVSVSKGNLFATDVTFQDNVAYSGAGVYINDGNYARFNRCSFFRNKAVVYYCEQLPGSAGGVGGGVSTGLYEQGRSAFNYCTFGKGPNRNVAEIGDFGGGGNDVAGGGTACPSPAGIDTANSTALTKPASCPARCPAGGCPVYTRC
eukprot:jgi/Chlat1/7177/Chrsp57S09128